MMTRSMKVLCPVLFCLVVLSVQGQLAPPATPAQPASVLAEAPAGPQVKFASPLHDFGKVSAGEPIKYDFIFTNTGTETLIVTNVQPSCGCTMAGEWTRQVEPGQTGKVPIQLNTSSLNGSVAKTITFVSNDKKQPVTYLQLKGTVWKPLDVMPPYAVLNITPDSKGASVKLTITNNTDTAVQVWEPHATNPAFQLEFATNVPGKSYQVTVSTPAVDKPGSIQGQVTLRTSYSNMPLLSITAWANVQPSLSVVPPALTLPQAPLPTKLTPIVTIINNTTNPLSLTEPAINVQGVDIQFREVQANRYFTVVFGFPAGFEAPAGTQTEFTLKSNNPKFPLIRIPINQPPRPLAAAVSPAQTQPQASKTPAVSSQPPPGERHALPRMANPAGRPPAPPVPAVGPSGG